MSKESLNLDAIMAAIESASTPEEELIAKLAGVTPVEKSEEIVETPEKPVVTTTEKNAEPEGDDLQKKAAEVDDQGRIMARAFFDELNKIAVGDVGITPNPAAVPDNPGIQLSNQGGVGAAAYGPADAVIQQLTASAQVGGPQGTIGVQGGAMQPIPGVAGVDEHPVAADAAKAKERAMADKTAADKAISALYKKFVGGE